jgi:hypothetical protein
VFSTQAELHRKTVIPWAEREDGGCGMQGAGIGINWVARTLSAS